MADHKKQHWVPRSYLKAWCDPATPAGQEPYVWVFPKDGGSPKRRAPSNLFTESEMYTIQLPDGMRDLTLEHGLAQLESEFVRVRDRTLVKREKLADNERAIILAFVAATQARSRVQRDHWRTQWAGLLEDVEALREAAKAATPEQRRAMHTLGPRSPASFSEKDVRELAEQPLQRLLVPIISHQIPILMRMHLTVLCTSDTVGFITSDAPCVWFDPEWHKRPAFYQAPSLGYETIEVTLPISPNQAAVLMWKPIQAGESYIDVVPPIVDEMNRRTRFHSDKEFVVRDNVLNPTWMDGGKPMG